MTFLIFLLFVALLVGFWFGGQWLINYDIKRKDRTQTNGDTALSVCRWILYAPLGIITGSVFGKVIEFLFSNQKDWFLSMTIMQIVVQTVQLAIIGFCFYIIIPLLNNTRKIQAAAITTLIISALLLFLFVAVGGSTEIDKEIIVSAISIFIAFVGSIFLIIKPETISE